MPTDDAGRDEEDGKQDQRGQGDLPTQVEHRPQHDDHRYQVANCIGQQIGKCLLRAEDIVVESADQRTCLRAREEGQGHALNVAKDL